MSWNDIMLRLIQTLLPLIAAMLVALLGYAIAYLRKQTEKIHNDVVERAISSALFEAESVARDAIHATQQTLVDDLKAKASDGKLTKEEAAQAIAAAQQYFVNHISSGSLQILESALGPVENWLKDYVEAKIGEQKGSISVRVNEIANPTSPAQAG